jgi:hypothetical protein
MEWEKSDYVKVAIICMVVMIAIFGYAGILADYI